MTGRHGSIAERLERHSIPEPNSGCLLWLGSVSAGGYGQLMLPGGIPRPAHRLAYELNDPRKHTVIAVEYCVTPSYISMLKSGKRRTKL